MIIKTVYIENFGKFNNYELKFEKGLNLVYGDNEAGKTTIMTFIMMAFYGSKQRKQDILENPRKKYAPWNKEKMKGYIIFSHKARDYRLERTFHETNKKDEVILLDNISGEEIQLEKGKEVGEYFFNMSFESFKKSLFIDSQDLFFSGQDSFEIKEKLLNLMTTSDEDISYGRTRELLEHRLYEFRTKSKKKGLLVDLEEELKREKTNLLLAIKDEEEKEKNLERLKRLKEEIELEDLKKDIEKLEKEIDLAQNYKSMNEKRKIIQANIKEHEEEKNHIYAALDQLQIDYHKQLAEKEALKAEKDRLLTDLKNLSSFRDDALIYGHKSPFLSLVFTILIVLASFFLFGQKLVENSYIKYGLLTLILVVTFLVLADSYRKNERMKKALHDKMEGEKQLQDLKVKEDDLNTEMRVLDANLLNSEMTIKEKEGRLDLIERSIASKKEDLQNIRDYRFTAALDPMIIEKTVDSLRALDEKYQRESSIHLGKYGKYLEIEDPGADRLLDLNKDYQILKGYSDQRYKNSRYPDEVRASIRYLEESLEEKMKDYQSIKEAIRILDRAYEDLSHDFGPLLNEKSQEIFKSLTGNKYEKLLISDDFDIKYEDDGQKQVKDWRYLSSGARDQVYISLKLALAKLLFEGQEGLLLLDDIFVKFDEKRAEDGLKFLKGLEEEFEQIIFFTCHKRIFDSLQGKVSRIII
ncbi:MAG: AAA family ATPase [Tissierellia bacterium]|nr:AAA family ATPase [Tissierellia bacterium]